MRAWGGEAVKVWRGGCEEGRLCVGRGGRERCGCEGVGRADLVVLAMDQKVESDPAWRVVGRLKVEDKTMQRVLNEGP